MAKFMGVKIPRRNGRPQLWTRACDDHESLRIILPDGRVDFRSWNERFDVPDPDKFEKWADKPSHKMRVACTRGRSQLEAIRNAIQHDSEMTGGTFKPFFLGYL